MSIITGPGCPVSEKKFRLNPAVNLSVRVYMKDEYIAAPISAIKKTTKNFLPPVDSVFDKDILFDGVNDSRLFDTTSSRGVLIEVPLVLYLELKDALG